MPPLPNNTHPQWWKDPGIRTLNLFLLSSYLGATANGYISTLITNLLANPHYLSNISGLSDTRLLGLVTASHSLGAILAFFPAPWVAETYGRRAAMVTGNMGMIAGFTGQIFSQTFAHFLGLRMLVGFSSIFNTVASAALLVELAHPRQRAVAGALFNTCFFVGSTTAAWVAFASLRIPGAWSWKLPIAMQLFWSLAQVALVVSGCPESPRWLVRHGKEEQAKSIMLRYHANGYQEDELVGAEFAAMLAELEVQERDRVASSWRALVATPGNRRRLLLSVVIAVATQWVGNGVISFYLAPVLRTVGITNAFQQQGINGGLQIFSWLLACAAALLCERAGRRRLLLTSAGTMLLFMILITICSALYSTTGSAAAGYAVIVFLFLFFGGYVIGLTPIPILYVNEIWPSHLRTKGTSVFWVSQAVAVCFNQFVNPVALDRIAWRYHLVYVGVLVAVINFMFFCVPETKGLSLEQVGDIFDGGRRRSVELEDLRLEG
ncbi:general substrate transporter [Stemphylium lycopersici]|nr:general substrate transporter [Stemphylium lycopersici]